MIEVKVLIKGEESPTRLLSLTERFVFGEGQALMGLLLREMQSSFEPLQRY